MKISWKEIEKALNFYEVMDEEYRQNCFKCVEDLNSNEEFYEKTEIVCDVLYNQKKRTNKQTLENARKRNTFRQGVQSVCDKHCHFAGM